jgi:superfamily I DNA/RNA helicase/RecB family exonuclease
VTGSVAEESGAAPRYRLVRRVLPRGAAAAVALGPAQREVVAHREGPLLVVGGAGTGKTTTLVEAVAARVAEGVAPERVLVLTFGRKSAVALRQRIEARIGAGRSRSGAATMTEPVVRTFPAYAFGLIRQAAAANNEPTPRLLTGAEQDAVIRDLLTDPRAARRWPGSLRQAVGTRAFAAELRDLILRCAERGIGPTALTELGRRHHRPDWAAGADFYREYLDVLALRDASGGGGAAYDQAELVRAASGLLTDEPDLLARERDRCRHIYVDELADTDPAQLDLLALVAGNGAHVVGFADPDSSIFAFRGADHGGVREFTDRFRAVDGREAPRVLFTVGYRCGPELVAASRRVAVRLRGPQTHRAIVPAPAPPVPLDEATGPDEALPLDEPSTPVAPLPPLEVCTLSSGASEAAYVAHRLREAHLRHGVPWSRMAVIVRSIHRYDAVLRRALIQSGVPVLTAAEDTALALQPAVVPLLRLVRRALKPSTLDEEDAVSLLHSPFGGADPYQERRLRQGLRELARASGDPRPSGELLVAALRDPAELAAVEWRWARPARDLAHLMAVVREAAQRPGASPEAVLWAVWRASGLADRWAAASARGGRRGEAADRDLDAIMVLFDAAARFTDRLPGARIESFVDTLADQQLPTDTLAEMGDRGGTVRMLTAHAAKGLEWDVVVVAGVQEGVWPDLRLRGGLLGSDRLVDVAAGRATGTVSQVSALLDEERRLFSVATSRARRSLLITAVDATSTGSGGEEQPSRFLAEIAGSGAAVVTGPDQVDGPDRVDGPDQVSGLDGVSGAAVEADAEPESPDPESGVVRGTLKRPLTLAALVAELRTVATDAGQPWSRREAAAVRLARLADARVGGADPDGWWGLRPLSDEGPLSDGAEPVRVSPSTVESVLRCGLRWLLERHGGSDPPSAKQTIGNLVHAAAMLVQEADFDPAQVRAFVTDRFGGIELPAVWLGARERSRADAMVDKLLAWLAENPRRQLAIEKEFAQVLPADEETGSPAVELKGRVDRLEADDQGRLIVVDLKTGASAPTVDDATVHPQLAAYQVAVQAGAFPEGSVPGGAEIVAVGTTSVKATVRVQPPLDDAEDPRWAEELVRRAATAMAGSAFRAIVNDTCAYCVVRTSCPVSGKGRQVTPG